MKAGKFIPSKLLVSEEDVKVATGLEGFRLYSHQRRKKRMIKLTQRILPPGASILDVGCASGDIAVELSSAGFNVTGIDFEPVRLKKAKELSQNYNQIISFEQNLLENVQGFYDLVLLGEVLEHFCEPDKILKNLKALLKPGGRLLITTPNAPSLRNRIKFGLFGMFPDNNPEHRYYFDVRRLYNIISNSGYEVENMTTRFTNIVHKGKEFSKLENCILFWFAQLFKKSGDTIFAVIRQK